MPKKIIYTVVMMDGVKYTDYDTPRLISNVNTHNERNGVNHGLNPVKIYVYSKHPESMPQWYKTISSVSMNEYFGVKRLRFLNIEKLFNDKMAI